MRPGEIEVILKKVEKTRKELKALSIDELKELLDSLKDAMDYISHLKHRIETGIEKLDDTINDIEIEKQEEDDLWD